MDEFLRSKLRQHTEVESNINLYLFENWEPRVELVELRQKVDIQVKLIIRMENKCKYLRLRVYFLTDKANLPEKKDKGNGMRAQSYRTRTSILDHHTNDGNSYPEKACCMSPLEARNGGIEKRVRKLSE